MRKLALLTTTVIAIMAMTAVSASAATQVRNSAGTLCSQVSPAINAGNAGFDSPTHSYASGGCSARVTASASNWSIYLSANGSNRQLCKVAFDARVGGDGWGYAENFSYTDCGVSISQCAGDRVISPPSHNPYGAFGFGYTNAATDLNMEMCGTALNSTWRGHVSLNVDTFGGLGRWTNQVPLDAVSWQHFRQGVAYTPTILNITQ